MKMDGTKIVYEAGDWVISRKDNEPKAFRITKIGSAGGLYDGDNGWLYDNQADLASQEEINKATGEEKIMVGEYEVEFHGDKIKVDCVYISKPRFLKIGKKAGWIDK